MTTAELLAKIIAIKNSDYIFTAFTKENIIDNHLPGGLYTKANDVYHYCSIDALKNILKNQCLRFTDVRFLNDTTEFTEIMNIIPNILKNQIIHKNLKIFS